MNGKQILCLAVAGVWLAFPSQAPSQERLNDKDFEKLIENLKEDSKKFSEHFKDDVEKSTIRRTSEEKDAKKASEQFVDQVDEMLDQFKDKKQVDRTLPLAYRTYSQLGRYMDKISPKSKTVESWTRVRDEMEQISRAANFVPPL